MGPDSAEAGTTAAVCDIMAGDPGPALCCATAIKYTRTRPAAALQCEPAEAERASAATPGKLQHRLGGRERKVRSQAQMTGLRGGGERESTS